MGPRVLQGESLEAFNEGIDYILNRWLALQTAVDYKWGGDNLKAQKFIVDVRTWFTQSKGKGPLIPFLKSWNLFYSDFIHCSFPEPFDIDELKTLINEGINAAFDLSIEDGSNEVVCCFYFIHLFVASNYCFSHYLFVNSSNHGFK
jgi:hypothetical protein